MLVKVLIAIVYICDCYRITSLDMIGGYTPATVTPRAKAILESKMPEIAHQIGLDSHKLKYKILNYETQLVAGTNNKYLVEFNNGLMYTIVIHKKLPSEPVEDRLQLISVNKYNPDSQHAY
nr:stefin 3 [Enteromyxum scophthalmi]